MFSAALPVLTQNPDAQLRLYNCSRRLLTTTSLGQCLGQTVMMKTLERRIPMAFMHPPRSPAQLTHEPSSEEAPSKQRNTTEWRRWARKVGTGPVHPTAQPSFHSNAMTSRGGGYSVPFDPVKVQTVTTPRANPRLLPRFTDNPQGHNSR